MRPCAHRPEEPELLQDKVVVVSGVGPGLGRAIALRCAKAGADVVLAARTKSTLDVVAKEVEALGRRALAVPADLTDAASVEALAAGALDAFGHVDLLVHNAFAVPPFAELTDADLDEVRRSFETTVYAALRLTGLFRASLAERGGAVVLINSDVLHSSKPTFGPYKMAKASLLAAAQTLASELGPQNIRVNTVAPAYVWAEPLQAYFGYLAEQRGVEVQAVYDETAAETDLRRLPEADQVANAVVFLGSPAAAAITGQCLDVNCGLVHN
ncbi:SDR family oxidoreductase [Amycolatopsis sp. NPDC004747]